VVSIVLPKAEQAKARKIQVTSAFNPRNGLCARRRPLRSYGVVGAKIVLLRVGGGIDLNARDEILPHPKGAASDHGSGLERMSAEQSQNRDRRVVLGRAIQGRSDSRLEGGAGNREKALVPLRSWRECGGAHDRGRQCRGYPANARAALNLKICIHRSCLLSEPKEPRWHRRSRIVGCQRPLR